jgi:hypothetical protein
MKHYQQTMATQLMIQMLFVLVGKHTAFDNKPLLDKTLARFDGVRYFFSNKKLESTMSREINFDRNGLNFLFDGLRLRGGGKHKKDGKKSGFPKHQVNCVEQFCQVKPRVFSF